MIIKYEYRIRTQFKKIKNKKQFLKFKLIFISILIILLLIFQIIKHAKKNEKYFCCFCAMGKMENRYSRELISYYMSIGVDKFVIADNNLPNTEKFSDILQDYIKNGTVDICIL